MRDAFRAYYRYTEDELHDLWGECLFVLDANVLLNLYRYSPKTRKELLRVLAELSDRLWIPHQVALEYQHRRVAAIAQERKRYTELLKWVRGVPSELRSQLEQFSRSPFPKADQWLERVERALSEVEDELERREQQLLAFLKHDTIRDTLDSLLQGKVGPSYTDDRLREIGQEGRERYQKEIPPGYKDGQGNYGDLILWYQTIDRAAEVQLPVILVTDDNKSDWWDIVEGERLGPRIELACEIYGKTGRLFHMYRPQRFLEWAGKYLKRDVAPDAIDEVREVAERSEARRIRTQEELPGAALFRCAALAKQLGETATFGDMILSSAAMQEMGKLAQEMSKPLSQTLAEYKAAHDMAKLSEDLWQPLGQVLTNWMALRDLCTIARAESDTGTQADLARQSGHDIIADTPQTPDSDSPPQRVQPPDGQSN